MFTTTPKKITSKIRDFCNRISENTKPIYLKVVPLLSSIKNECFQNVRNYISHNGGSIQYGWRIWEWEGIMVEAEFHSVWISPDGNFLDISPADEKRILFLPDNSSTYEGITRNNIRASLISDPLVDNFVEVNNQISEIRIKAGTTETPENQVFSLFALTSLGERQEILMRRIADRYFKPSSLCFCGSGRKYEMCHK